MIRVLVAVDDEQCRRQLRHWLAESQDITLVGGDGMGRDDVIRPLDDAACDVVVTANAGAAEAIRRGKIDAERLRAWIRDCHSGVGVVDAGSLLAVLDGAVHPLVRPPLSEEEERRVADLTAREMEVLSYITTGLSTRSVARRLYISEKTVRNHLSNAMRKLAVENRIQAALLMLRAQIPLPPDDDLADSPR